VKSLIVEFVSGCQQWQI